LKPAVLLAVEDPAAAAADRLAAAVNAGGQIALTGGSTPRTTYERLATMQVDWSACTLWFGDERCVPPNDERSNFGMVREALLDRLPDPIPDTRRIEGERGPAEAADAYERELRQSFGDPMPRFDLVLLGVGPDAHCASLFPNHEALAEKHRLAVAVERPGFAPWVSRVTLTLPVLNAARQVLFLVSGKGKAEAVARAFSGAPRSDAPASMVRPASGSLDVLLDPAAAGLLGSQATRSPGEWLRR
jgi:6-phosphogluconolactonase